MQRVISISELLATKRKLMGFEGVWLNHLGNPERSGAWLIWGKSAHGKSTYVVKLMRYMAEKNKVLFYCLEERNGESIAKKMIEFNMSAVSKNFGMLQSEPLEDMIARLKKPKSAHVIVIDSLQYLGIEKSDYINLQALFPDKLFIYISHADGMKPLGSLASFVRYDASIKIHVNGFLARADSRYFTGGQSTSIIIREGPYELFWGIHRDKPKL